MAEQSCAVCGEQFAFRWTDTHGIAACSSCGCPYRLYHYDERNQRVARPPTLAVKESWLPLAREYWRTQKRRVFPAAYDMGFLGGRGQTYSGATQDDCEAFDAFLVSRQAEWPEADELPA